MKATKMLRYDWTNLRADLVGSGQGLPPADLEAHRPQARRFVQS